VQAVAATIAAKPHLSSARVLARSFRACHPGIPFFVLLADEVDGWFDPAAEPFDLVRLESLGLSGVELLRFQYAQQPFSYALTPFLLSHLLDAGARRVLFFKQESLVLDSHAEVLQLLDQHPIVVTPHLTSPLCGADRIGRELNILQSGVFNVGLLGVSATPPARRMLNWWGDRVRDHCLRDVPQGMHYEQRWLDLVLGYFDGVHVLRDSRFNVAHWNLPERRIEIRDGRVFADGRPCGLFRFSGYEPERPERITKYSARLSADNVGAAAAVFDQYRAALRRDGYEQTSRWPYAFAAFDNGVEIPECVRDLARRLGPRMRTFGDPRRTAGTASFFSWLREPVDCHRRPATCLPRLWHWIYQERPDLQSAFPAVLTTDRERFLQWTERFGTLEHRVPAAFVRPYRDR
jgi:hypothetical protein